MFLVVVTLFLPFVHVMICYVQVLEVATQFNMYLCATKDHSYIRTVTIAIIYLLKGILQIFALFFAFQTRQVKVKGLKDAKFIAAIVYITSFQLVVYLIATLLLREYLVSFAVVFGSGLLIGATTIMGCIFLPGVSSETHTHACTHTHAHTHTQTHTHQMVRLYKDKRGGISEDSDREGTHLAHTVLAPPPRTPSHTAPVAESYDGLRRRIKELEAKLKQCEVSLPIAS